MRFKGLGEEGNSLLLEKGIPGLIQSLCSPEAAKFISF